MPFAGYESFAACVEDNQDKASPEGFCAWLHYQATGDWPGDLKEAPAMTWAERAADFWRRHADGLELSRKQVEALCPGCAEKMAAAGLETVTLAEKQIPDDMKAGLCERFEPEDGFFTRCVESTLGDFDPADQESFCAWLHYQCLGKWPGEKAAEKSGAGPELTGPIVGVKDAEKQIAYAAVLVPGEEDADGEALTAHKIEDVAHEWLRSYRHVDLMHTLNAIATPVESYVTPKDLYVGGQVGRLPAGTWVLASKIESPEVWQKVKTGELTGYSVMGIRRHDLAGAQKSGEAPGLRKTLLEDLGDDWIAAAVSVVENPAVPKAKFFALKAAQDPPAPWWQRLKDMVAPAPKAGRVLAERNWAKLRQALDLLNEVAQEAEAERGDGQEPPAQEGAGKSQQGGDVDMDREELKELVAQAVKEELAAQAGAQKGTEEQGGEGEAPAQEETGQGETAGEEMDQESFKAEILERLERLEQGRTTPRALKGQDGQDGEDGQEAEGMADRDVFGRKIKHKGGK